MQRDAIMLTLGQKFFKLYPGGERQVRRQLERMNNSDNYYWMQLCGSGVPKVKVDYCYLVFNGKVQYRCDIVKYSKRESGEFTDGGITRVYSNKNMVYLQGPTITAPCEIPFKGFQGIRYTELLF